MTPQISEAPAKMTSHSDQGRVRSVAGPFLLLGLNLLAALCAFGPWSGVNRIEEIPWRILLAGFTVTLFPGLLLGQAIGMKTQHPLEWIAKSFSISLILAIAFALFVFCLGGSIAVWSSLILGWNTLWALWLLCDRRRSDRPGFIIRLWEEERKAERTADTVLLLAIGLIAFGLYRWADELNGVEWEVGLHLMYVRQYASGLPLDFIVAKLRPELHVPNLFFLWEFMLAGISNIAGLDPLVVALRSRWLVPVLGFSSFFFMVLQMTGSLRKARQVTWIVLIAALLQFLYLSPSPFVTTGIVEPFRQLTAFMGSIHHSDTAMEILLPLGVGYLFLFLRLGGIRNWLGLGGMLIASFFWHPREYFQIMWYGLIAFLNGIVVNPFRRVISVFSKRYVFLLALFLLVSSAFFIIAVMFSQDPWTSGHEMNQKKYFLNWLISTWAEWNTYLMAGPLFGFPIHGYITSGVPSPPNIFSWMVLGVCGMLPMLWVSPRKDLKCLSFYLLLWWLTLCYYKSQIFLTALTYSEIMLASPRFVFLFSYVVMGLGWFAWMKMLDQELKGRVSDKTWVRNGLSILICFVLGVFFAWGWNEDLPHFRHWIPALSGIVGVTALGLAMILVPYIPWSRWVARYRMRWVRKAGPGMWVGIAAFVVFLLPICWGQFTGFAKEMVTRRVEVKELFSDQNPIGISWEMIRYIREKVPVRSRILVEPVSTQMIGIYAPQYQTPLPQGNYMGSGELEQRTMAEKDEHPVYNRRTRKGVGYEKEKVEAFLKEHKIEYVLGRGDYVRFLKGLTEKYPNQFERVFESNEGREILIHFVSNKVPSQPAPRRFDYRDLVSYKNRFAGKIIILVFLSALLLNVMVCFYWAMKDFKR